MRALPLIINIVQYAKILWITNNYYSLIHGLITLSLFCFQNKHSKGEFICFCLRYIELGSLPIVCFRFSLNVISNLRSLLVETIAYDIPLSSENCIDAINDYCQTWNFQIHLKLVRVVLIIQNSSKTKILNSMVSKCALIYR